MAGFFLFLTVGSYPHQLSPLRVSSLSSLRVSSLSPLRVSSMSSLSLLPVLSQSLLPSAGYPHPSLRVSFFVLPMLLTPPRNFSCQLLYFSHLDVLFYWFLTFSAFTCTGFSIITNDSLSLSLDHLHTLCTDSVTHHSYFKFLSKF